MLHIRCGDDILETLTAAGDPANRVVHGQRRQSPLPHLEPAFQRHLQEFPAVGSGLARTEELTLQIIAEGITRPLDMFRELQRREERFWVGDAMFWPYLDTLATAQHPLLRIEGSGPWPSRGNPTSAREVFMTPAGEAVLGGQRDRIALNGIDRWLGGVHLQG